MIDKLNILNLPILLALITGLGVLVHDTQLDMAAYTVMAKQASADAVRANNNSVKFSDYHIHTNRQHIKDVRSNEARNTPRTSEERKYAVSKRVSVSSGGLDYAWPS